MRRLSVWTCVVLTGLWLSAAPRGQQAGLPAPPRPGAAPGAPGQPNTTTTGTGVILGQAVDADTGRPVAGALLTLGGLTQGPVLPGSGPAQPQVMSNSDGYFVFRDVPRSTQTISAQKSGYLVSSYGQRRPDGGPARSIDIADGQRVVDVVVRMWKVGVITGRVVDDVGEPVVGVTVRTARREATGRLVTTGQGSTDDRGVYRVAGLAPAEYVAFVNSTFSAVPRAVSGAIGNFQTGIARDVPNLALGMSGTPLGDMVVMTGGALSGVPINLPTDPGSPIEAYPTTFHPGSPTPADAAAVRVTSGAERSGVDIQLKLTRMFSVSGVVEGPEGPLGQMGISLAPAHASSFSLDFNLDTAITATGPDGRFTFMGVPPGQYEVRALRIPRPTTQSTQVSFFAGGGSVMTMAQTQSLPPAGDEPTLWARAPVSVGRVDVTGVLVTVRSGTRLRGSVMFAEGPAPPAPDRQRFSIGVQASNDRQQSLPQPAPIDADLRFTTAEYPAGRYFVSINSAPAGWMAVEARVRGVNALAEPIVLDGAASEDDIVVTMSNRPPKIAGTVRASSSGDPNAVVIAFPANHRAWIEAGMLGRLLRTVDVRPNGTFEISNVVPGSYALVAVPADAPVDTRDPEAIDRLAQRGTVVSVGAGEQKTQALTVVSVR